MMQRSIFKSVILLCFILQTSVALLAGCNRSQTAPPELISDRLACKQCNMLVSELRYAAAFEDPAGNTPVFDDIGCMLAAIRKMQKVPDHIWVRDYNSDCWLAADSAFYVAAQKLATPMNYGYVAAGTALEAERIAQSSDGTVIRTWNDLLRSFRKGTS